jgi:hypothetical protein
VNIPKADEYEVDLVYSCVSYTKSQINYLVNIGPEELKSQMNSVRGGFQVATVGHVKLPAGQTQLRFHLALEKTHGVLLRLREVRLIPES